MCITTGRKKCYKKFQFETRQCDTVVILHLTKVRRMTGFCLGMWSLWSIWPPYVGQHSFFVNTFFMITRQTNYCQGLIHVICIIYGRFTLKKDTFQCRIANVATILPCVTEMNRTTCCSNKNSLQCFMISSCYKKRYISVRPLSQWTIRLDCSLNLFFFHLTTKSI